MSVLFKNQSYIHMSIWNFRVKFNTITDLENKATRPLSVGSSSRVCILNSMTLTIARSLNIIADLLVPVI